MDIKTEVIQVVEFKATLYLIVCDPGVELAKSISPVDVFINTNPVVKYSENVPPVVNPVAEVFGIGFEVAF